MNKELEMTNIEFLKEHIEQLKEVLFVDDLQPALVKSVGNELKYWKNILKDLLELKVIKEAKPSEALECLEEIGFVPLNECCGYPYTRISDEYEEDYNTIKQALLELKQIKGKFDENKKSDITGLSFNGFKEIHKNDTPIVALDHLHRLSLAPDYVKPNSVEEMARRFLRDKVEQALLKAQEEEKELKHYKEMMTILIEILKGCKMRYEDTLEPNMRLYISKDICEKINKFLEMLEND